MRDAPRNGAEAPPPPPQPEEQGINSARLIRFVVLLGVLAAVIVVIVSKECRSGPGAGSAAANAPAGAGEAPGENTASAVNASLHKAREALRAHDFEAVDNELKYIHDLDPDSHAGRRMFTAVKAIHAAETDDLRLLDFAGGQFNALDYDKLLAAIPAEQGQRARRALDAFPEFERMAAPRRLDQRDLHYIQNTAWLWRLARRLTADDVTDTDRALRLCRWFALHVAPDRTRNVSGLPVDILRRAYGTPTQAAWAYAELARQIGVQCTVVELQPTDTSAPAECLVQVHPDGDEPFLVNPHAGVPVFDVATGRRMSLAQLAEKPAAYAALCEVAGIESPVPPGAFRGAEPRTPVQPQAFFERILAFDLVLEDVPDHPAIVLDFAALPAGELKPWPRVTRDIMRMQQAEQSQRRLELNAGMQMLGRARAPQMEGEGGIAAALYKRFDANLRETLADADMPEAIALLERALETTAFMLAVNSYDWPSAGPAHPALESYLRDYPDGRWHTLATVMLAETLASAGDTSAAMALWQDPPPGRELYCALRLRGLLAAEPGATPESP